MLNLLTNFLRLVLAKFQFSNPEFPFITKYCGNACIFMWKWVSIHVKMCFIPVKIMWKCVYIHVKMCLYSRGNASIFMWKSCENAFIFMWKSCENSFIFMWKLRFYSCGNVFMFMWKCVRTRIHAPIAKPWRMKLCHYKIAPWKSNRINSNALPVAASPIQGMRVPLLPAAPSRTGICSKTG